MNAAVPRWAVLLLAALFAAVPWLLERLAEPAAALRLAAAAFAETLDDERSREVALPHRWHVDCEGCRTVWYRFDLTRPDAPRDSQAIVVPAVGHNAAIYFNGRLLGQGGRFADPVARLGARGLWAAVPPSAWQAGANRFYVLVKADRPRAGLLAAPALGADAELAGPWGWRQALAVTGPQVIATAATMLALVMAVLAFYRWRDAGYVALTVAGLAFAVRQFSLLVVEPPVGGAAWDGWLETTAGLHAAAVALLALRLLDPAGERRGALRALAAVAVLTPLAAGAGAMEASGQVHDLLKMLARVALACVGAGLAVAGWRRHDGALLWPGAVLALLGAADALRLPLLPEALPALPWAMAALLGSAGWRLLQRFVDTLNAVELLNIDLDALVRERTAKLQAQFERVRELERREAIATERERLMRDMHDGVGGHLVSMLAMIEADRRRPGELATVVREALDDMRLMIDSLDPVDDDLNAVLAMFRDRLAPRLRSSDVTLHWDVELLPQVAGLTPARVLHVLRMLQEAVTNAIRHGHARTLWIGAAVDAAGGVRIEVRDDGAGFDPQAVHGGRGLKNLARRAREVGATLDIRSAPGTGASVVVRLSAATDGVSHGQSPS